MKPPRREKLLGYLLDALDGNESAAIDRAVARDDTLHAELTQLAGELQPLSLLQGYYRDEEDLPPPPGLAEKTSEQIWQTLDKTPEPEPQSQPQSFVRIDPPAVVIRPPRQTVSQPAPPQRSWIGAFVSMAVGLLFAVLLFPIFDFVKAKVIVRVAQVLMRDVEENLEYYKQMQETNAVVRAREADGAVIVAKSHWRTIRPDATLVDPKLPKPTADILDAPITAIPNVCDQMCDQNCIVESSCDQEIKTPMMLMLQPNRWLDAKRPIRSFDGGSLFISDGHVYFRTVPMGR